MKKILLTVFAAAVSLVSCTDDSKFESPAENDLTNGAFVKFADNYLVPATISLADGATAGMSGEIYDANNNIASYSLTMQATVSGEVRTIEDFVVITDLPTTLAITVQDIADGLGLTIDDLNFGDSFAFTAIVTRNDGTVFNATAPSYDDANGTIGVGNTEPTLNDNAATGYFDAMLFGFTFACPAWDVSEITGTYTITADPFATSEMPTFDIVEGPGANQVTLIDVFGHARSNGLTSPGTFDVILDIDPAANGASLITGNQDAWDSAQYGLTYGIAFLHDGSGLFLPCAGGLFTIDWTHSVGIGSWGVQHFEATRN